MTLNSQHTFPLPSPFLFHPSSFLFHYWVVLSMFTMTTVNFRIFLLSKKKERKKTTHSLAVTSHFSSSLSTRQPLINLPFYVYSGHFLWMKSYNVWSFVMNSSHFFQSSSTVYMHQCIISLYCQIIFKCA